MTISLDDFVHREIIHSANTLIADLQMMLPALEYKIERQLSTNGDDLMRLLEIVDWQEPVERYIGGLSRSELIDCLENIGDDAPHEDIGDDGELRARLLTCVQETDDGWQEFAEAYSIEPDRSEVYEFWVVTNWLGEKLREKGHPVEEICGFTVWGRPTTGQHISMDSVIQEIYEETML